MKTNLLKSKMVAKRLTPHDLVTKIKEKGVRFSLSSYYSRMKEERDFSRSEILAISDILDLSDKEVLDIFFDEKVS